MRTKSLFFAILLASAPLSSFAQDYSVGMIAHVKGDYALALRVWTPLAEQGEAPAQSMLGEMYGRGEGVPKDYVEAMRWFRLAADQGYAQGQINLGVLYYNGDGVSQDYVLAHMWFNIAAASGSAIAAEYRAVVAGTMTPTDISEAQRRASVCLKSNYQDCE